uniref:Uncharacterized protein n=1 Tax=Lepeophtheirus salmonis TaxID=72036 RepID=A0A0K2U4B6_LEPSM
MLHLVGRVCQGPVFFQHIIIPGERALQPWQDMVHEDLVIGVHIDFLVGLEEVGRHLAGVGSHDLSWIFGPQDSLDMSY